MELYNGISDYHRAVPENKRNKGLLKETLVKFMQILAPFAPHRSEEMWECSGFKGSIFESTWPKFEEQFLSLDTVKIGAMVNGKFRGEVEVPTGADQKEAEEIAKTNEKVQRALSNMNIVKIIFVKGKMINFVVKPT
jgi:leucyl-tRNA synthetase